MQHRRYRTKTWETARELSRLVRECSTELLGHMAPVFSSQAYVSTLGSTGGEVCTTVKLLPLLVFSLQKKHNSLHHSAALRLWGPK